MYMCNVLICVARRCDLTWKNQHVPIQQPSGSSETKVRAEECRLQKQNVLLFTMYIVKT